MTALNIPRNEQHRVLLLTDPISAYANNPVFAVLLIIYTFIIILAVCFSYHMESVNIWVGTTF